MDEIFTKESCILLIVKYPAEAHFFGDIFDIAESNKIPLFLCRRHKIGL
jgi:hypothetical protein